MEVHLGMPRAPPKPNVSIEIVTIHTNTPFLSPGNLLFMSLEDGWESELGICSGVHITSVVGRWDALGPLTPWGRWVEPEGALEITFLVYASIVMNALIVLSYPVMWTYMYTNMFFVCMLYCD